MTLIWALLVVVVLGVTAAIAVGYGGALGTAYPDRRDVLLPTDRRLTAEDIEDVEFSVTVRGYRMDEVDETLRRLRTELAERDEQIAALEHPRHRAPETSAPDRPAGAAPPQPGQQPGPQHASPARLTPDWAGADWAGTDGARSDGTAGADGMRLRPAPDERQ